MKHTIPLYCAASFMFVLLALVSWTAVANAYTTTEYDNLVSYIEDIRDNPANTAVRGNPHHIAKWNRVLSLMGENGHGQTPMDAELIHSNAAKWPDSPWKPVSDYLKWKENQPEPPQAQSQEVDPPDIQTAALQSQTLVNDMPEWLRNPDDVARWANADGTITTLNFLDDAEYTDIKGWGGWDELPDTMRNTLKTYDPITGWTPVSSHVLDTKPLSSHMWNANFLIGEGSEGPCYTTSTPQIGNTCLDGSGTIQTISFVRDGGPRHALATYEGGVVGSIHPNVAHDSLSNPYGLDDPRIHFRINFNAKLMDASISYAHWNPGDDLSSADAPRRSHLDVWNNIDISNPVFVNDGLTGQFYNGGEGIYGTVQRQKIIGRYRAEKQ